MCSSIRYLRVGPPISHQTVTQPTNCVRCQHDDFQINKFRMWDLLPPKAFRNFYTAPVCPPPPGSWPTLLTFKPVACGLNLQPWYPIFYRLLANFVHAPRRSKPAHLVSQPCLQSWPGRSPWGRRSAEKSPGTFEEPQGKWPVCLGGKRPGLSPPQQPRSSAQKAGHRCGCTRA